ncbi:hypothetical protein Hdeb2414_s0023g00643311 [Helianthus debilis subsp. tardiflorus]
MRMSDQSAAIKLAICDDIGERSYDVTDVLVQMLSKLLPTAIMDADAENGTKRRVVMEVIRVEKPKPQCERLSQLPQSLTKLLFGGFNTANINACHQDIQGYILRAKDFLRRNLDGLNEAQVTSYLDELPTYFMGFVIEMQEMHGFMNENYNDYRKNVDEHVDEQRIDSRTFRFYCETIYLTGRDVLATLERIKSASKKFFFENYWSHAVELDGVLTELQGVCGRCYGTMMIITGAGLGDYGAGAGAGDGDGASSDGGAGASAGASGAGASSDGGAGASDPAAAAADAAD